MKRSSQEIYKQLVDSYYNGEFEITLRGLYENEFESKEEAKEVLSVLCGVDSVDAEDDYLFVQQLIHGITNQRVREKIVQKIHSCSEDCETVDGKSKCQSVCPFDAILKDKDSNDKTIDESLCMSCGRCVSVCELGNYLDTPQFLPLADLLRKKEKVYAIVAPAIAGQFGEETSLDQLREAFMKIGFTDMVEVAFAADVLSLKEALEFNTHVKKEGDFMISSCCCPMWVAALRKVYHELMPDVSPSVSPMIAMARIIKALNEDVKVVFVGPCIAKKAEAKESDLIGDVDFVLTFAEVEQIFDLLDIVPGKLKGVPSVDYASTGGRLYGRSGGVSQAVWDIVDQLFPEKRELFSSLHVDGMANCKTMLSELKEKQKSASFIEGMGCKGGCVGGPKAIIPTEVGRSAVNDTARESAIKIPVNSQILADILKRLGVRELKDLKEGHSMFERDFN